ncbi:MAG: CocE/NonD family hydrolase [Phycisphaeraceae bacterium]|nr:CocE/NonD family hydrolase [Phycisphaeraceae bacterium]
MRITLRAFSLSLSLVLAPMILGCSPTATTTLQGSWPAPRGPEGPPVLPVANEGVIVEYHRPVPMRDGVRLSATIYRPAAPGRYPVILSRTPYVKASVGQAGVDRRLKFVRAGYAWADVDVRGRGDSDGSFRPFFQEGEDGYDTIEWCGRQPWSTGKVGMVGGSYGGYVQLAAGVRRPPSLACLVPSVACPDPFVDGLLMGPTGLPGPLSVSWYQYTTGRMNQSSAATPWAQVFKHRPLITLDDAAGIDLPFWNEIVEHSQLSPWWEGARYQNKLDRLAVPALHVSGWYDDEQVSTLTNYVRASTTAADPAARSGQKLLMGPWPHAINTSTKVGDIEFGPTAVIDLDALILRWFERHLKSVPNGIDQEPPVRLFVMGSNVWRSEADWPIPRTAFTAYHFHSAGRANSSDGDGVLAADLPSSPSALAFDSADADTYVYDPQDPTPFITDQNFSQVGGPDDYRHIERRDDVLVYTTPPLTASVELCGPVRVVLWATTDAPDTDFAARLCIVRADGTSQRLCDGIVRARFREGMDRPSLVTPGVPVEYSIDLWSTCQAFMPGERIRVQISSSSFPQWDANPNTGERLGFETSTRKATQIIHHDVARPSRIILPVVPASGSGLSR